MSEPLNLAQKIALVQTELSLDRDKNVKISSPKGSYSYDYVTEGAIMNAIRDRLCAQGVAVLVSVDEVERDGNMTIAHLSAVFTDGINRLVVQGAGCGTDNADKGLGKAITSGVRYMLCKTFLQSGDRDPEEEYVEHTKAPTRATRAKATEDTPGF